MFQTKRIVFLLVFIHSLNLRAEVLTTPLIKEIKMERGEQVLLQEHKETEDEIKIEPKTLDTKAPPKSGQSSNQNLEAGFYMREYKTNYAISGEPDTKIQFSFKFKLIQDINLYLGFTQVLFWELEKKSRPFSDQNFNPDLFYDLSLNSAFFKKLRLGYEHVSNGKAGPESRSFDSLFATLIGFEDFKYGVTKLHLKLRSLHRLDKTNTDISDFYGPIVLKLFFERIGKKLFNSEEFFLEYYASDSFKDIVDRSSFRLSLRLKIFKTKTTPKLFFQYFNGYGENLANYNQKTETFRVGVSIGGN